MASLIDNSCDMPQWKRDLILRIRSKSSSSSKTSVESEHQQLVGSETPRSSSATGDRFGQQPNPTCCTSSVNDNVRADEGLGVERCKIHSASSVFNSKMVQERCWMDSKQVSACDIVQENGTKELDADNPDEFRYGPGIVNKLKNRYLSLTLRENNARIRSSILPLRKATSLENILDNDLEEPQPKYVSTSSRIFEPKKEECKRNVTNRYRNATRGCDQKRARSVETISRTRHEEHEFITDHAYKRESVHEEVLIITEASDNNKIRDKINRPKRIVPVISDSEKPPADLIQQAKKIFEGRPEKRTRAPQPTGEVAAKVATYKSIIVQTKVNNKKPPIKQKPVALHGDKRATKPALEKKNSSTDKEVDSTNINKSVVENGTSELEHLIRPSQLLSNSDWSWISRQNSAENAILTSPIPDISRVKEGDSKEPRNGHGLSETPDLLVHSSPTHSNFKISATKDFINGEIDHSNNTSNSILPVSNSTEIKAEIGKFNKSPVVRSPVKSPTNGFISNGSPILSPISSDTSSKLFNDPSVKERARSPMRLEFGSKEDITSPSFRTSSPDIHEGLSSKSSGNSFTYNLSKSNVSGSHLPQAQTPPIQKVLSPLLIEVNGIGKASPKGSPLASPRLSPSGKPRKFPCLPLGNNENSPHISNKTELITSNSYSPLLTTKTVNPPKIKDSPKIDVVIANGVKIKSADETRTLKPKRSNQDYQQNSIVFKFTDRKDVPDYVCNDGRIRSAKIERPKVGEGGIIILPGVSLDESVVDDEDDWLLLAGPPSPCDVFFVNDNILIDGRSSLRDKGKKSVRVKLTFVETVPEVFEYPSEDSLQEDFSSNVSSSTPGHTVPSLSVFYN
ncbi:uncharacterized protein LOC108743780 isoform X2 [Agrilus planipennis]|uniref:Uncharacterized protein LOC108743780 isoform X2 n=1 Tax=Agrilus planipennis TaxID=224129 RepID=A0A7F5R541_AGRPL|nr:uncharacterized protein LOC108743780 isoform X2 [Agrilus planipennis]